MIARQFQRAADAACPDAAALDVVGETLLARIEVDGRDSPPGLEQRHGDMDREGGFAGTALLAGDDDHVRRPAAPASHHVAPRSPYDLHRTNLKAASHSVKIRTQAGSIHDESRATGMPDTGWRGWSRFVRFPAQRTRGSHGTRTDHCTH